MINAKAEKKDISKPAGPTETGRPRKESAAAKSDVASSHSLQKWGRRRRPPPPRRRRRRMETATPGPPVRRGGRPYRLT